MIDIEEMYFQAILIIIIPILLLIIYLIGHYRRNKEEEIKEKDELQESGQNYNPIYSIRTNHIFGLPLTENSSFILHLCNNKIIIDGAGKIFKLPKDKILDMNIKTSKEVQNSISGAVGGYILLGPIGAFLGGSTTEFHRFFIIIYQNKENKEECISFDIKDDIKSFKEINQYIEEFKNNIKFKKERDL